MNSAVGAVRTLTYIYCCNKGLHQKAFCQAEKLATFFCFYKVLSLFSRQPSFETVIELTSYLISKASFWFRQNSTIALQEIATYFTWIRHYLKKWVYGHQLSEKANYTIHFFAALSCIQFNQGRFASCCYYFKEGHSELYL